MHIDVHEHALEDLNRIRTSSAGAVAAVLATLEQLQADPLALDKLTTFGNNDTDGTRFNVKRWESARNAKGDLWRLRVLDTPATAYRVVYGYYWPSRQICVLAIASKEEFDYDTQSDLGRRILADWRDF